MPIIGGLYTGISYDITNLLTPASVTEADEKLAKLVEDRQQDSVVAISMIPTAFCPDPQTPQNPKHVDYTVNRPATLDGYTPKNNKLFTAPYCFVDVDTLNSSKSYKFELSATPSKIDFTMFCSPSPNPEIVTVPLNYNGSRDQILPSIQNKENFTESVTCTGFPQCAFTVDSYRAWLAQKATGEAVHLVGSLATMGAGIGVALSNPMIGTTMTIRGGLNFAETANQMLLESTEGSKVRGTIGSSTEVGTGGKAVYFKTMTVKAEYAKMIDDFFSRYGYACGETKIPNRNVRPHWTYTKTANASIRGSVPVDDMAKIKSIYNNGITFWRNGNEVGNYLLDNKLVT